MSRRAGTMAQGAAAALLKAAIAQSVLLERGHGDHPGVQSWLKDGRACRTSHPDAHKITLAGLLARGLYHISRGEGEFAPSTAQRGYELAADAVLHLAWQQELGQDLHQVNEGLSRRDLQRLLEQSLAEVVNDPESIPSKGDH